MGEDIYISFWNSKIPDIINQFESGKIQFLIDVKELSNFGNRQSYSSNFYIINGRLDRPENAYAQGRDLFKVLSENPYFKENLIDKILHVTISKDLKLKIEMEENIPPFFEVEDFNQLRKFAGHTLDRNVTEKESTYQYLKETYRKVEYWAEQVLKKTFESGGMHVKKKPTNQASNFERYLWAKIYPTNELKEWKVLAYTLSISDDEHFCVKIDTVGLSDNDPIRQKYFGYRGDFFNSQIVKIFQKDTILSSDWNNLIERSCKAIESLQTHYDTLLTILGFKENLSGSSGNIDIEHGLNTILYGPPGTGKTYNSIDIAVSIVDGTKGDHDQNKNRFDQLKKEGQIEFITFHQNYTYEDFMVGLKPELESTELKFKRVEGVFLRICKRAEQNYLATLNNSTGLRPFEEVLSKFLEPLHEKDEEIEVKMSSGKASFWITDINPSNLGFRKQSGGTDHTLSIDTIKELYEGVREFTSGLRYYYVPLLEQLWKLGRVSQQKADLKKYVLVIDEINRANISKVFGELITLLEPDKRLGTKNELKVSIPNTDKEFGVPPNLYVLGTMNTADKSIALIDIALRRRFDFIGKYPEYDRIANLEARELLKRINTAIMEKKGSADFLIGHAYFMNNNSIEENLRNKVIPLLLEYFMGKTDFVTDVFKESSWTVTYNKTTYGWDISTGVK